jgi:hypothetical protein
VSSVYLVLRYLVIICYIQAVVSSMATDRLTEAEFSLIVSSMTHKDYSCIATPLSHYLSRVESSEAEDLLL